jgi:hypothetical protein
MDGSIEPVGAYPLEPVAGSGRGLAVPVRDGFITWKIGESELRFHDWTGTLRRISRLPIEPDPVPDSLQQQGPNVSPFLAPVVYVTTDHDGYLWMAGEQSSLRAPAEALHVVSPDGRYLGEVGLPPRFHPMDIGRDWILGVWRDELDVEYLRVHNLERRGRGR